MPDSTSAIQQPQTATPRWFTPALFLVAALVQFMALLITTLLRYSYQGLDPELFNLTRTGNIVGVLVQAPLILTFLVMAFVSAHRRTALATSMILISGAELVTLTMAAATSTLQDKFLIPGQGAEYIFAGILLMKAFQYSILYTSLRQGRGGRWRSALRILGFALLAMVIAMSGVIAAVLLSPIGPTVVAEPDKQFDAAVVLGAAVWSHNKPSPVLRERVKRGYDLLRTGAVQFIVVTGGSAPGELPEAEVARGELIALGADPTRIVMETHTNSTEAQIFYIRDQLFKQGWNSFVIVSDLFHLKRALDICSFNGIDAVGVSSQTPLGTQSLAFYNLRESAALLLYWVYGV